MSSCSVEADEVDSLVEVSSDVVLVESGSCTLGPASKTVWPKNPGWCEDGLGEDEGREDGIGKDEFVEIEVSESESIEAKG